MNSQFQFVLSFFFPLFPIHGSEGANILFYHSYSSYSHRIAVWPLVKALADRGHNVTFHQRYPPRTPNPKVREFYPESLEHNFWAFEKEEGTMIPGNRFLRLRLENGPYPMHSLIFRIPSIGLRVCDGLLSSPEFHHFFHSNEFDLVIIDAIWNECAYGLAQKWGAKTILYYPSSPTGVWCTEPLGFLGSNELWIADLLIPDKMPNSFLQRVKTASIATAMHLIKQWIYYPSLSNLFETKLNITNVPSVPEMLQKTSLVLYNNHFSEGEARSLPPLYVPVPAMHTWDTKTTPLPNDIAEFIERSGEGGFIYVSFGGEVDITKAPEEFQNIFLNVFAKSKFRFLWKRSGERPKGMSDNVLIRNWMPQQDIFASPRCRAFITHAGLLGLQEAIMHGVPMIAMPIFADQDYNAFRIERTGRGIKLEIHTLTDKELEDAIVEILRNNSYKKNVEKVSKQLKDQQNSPIDTAVFWTEYVLRNDDMSTLRPMSRRDFYWFQIYFLDVWAFLTLVVSTFTFAILYISKRIFMYFWTTKKSHTKPKPAKKVKEN